jgi:hypothetical protein
MCLRNKEKKGQLKIMCGLKLDEKKASHTTLGKALNSKKSHF